jgi:hypothetical protein
MDIRIAALAYGILQSLITKNEVFFVISGATFENTIFF